MDFSNYITEDKVKLPQGYRVSVKKIKIGPGSYDYMYDCSVSYNGSVVVRTSQTLFNYAEQAREYGKELALISAGIKKPFMEK